MQTPTSADYERIVETHRRALKRIELDLSFFIRDVGDLNVFSISGRVKDYSRALAKAKALGFPVSDLDDLAGVRVVVGTEAEVPIVLRFFSRQEESKDLKVLKTRIIKRKSGYRATHLVVETRSSYNSSVFPGRVEIQVNTIFQHAFNFLSRNWRYNQPWETSEEWSAKFVELSNILSSIDQAASDLHLQQIQLQEAVDSAVLTPYSVRLIIKCEFGEDISIQNAVDACRMYVDLGYKTNGGLRTHFRDTRINELYVFFQDQTAKLEQEIPALKMTKYTFWSIFGTRVNAQGLKAFIAALPRSS